MGFPPILKPPANPYSALRIMLNLLNRHGDRLLPCRTLFLTWINSDTMLAVLMEALVVCRLLYHVKRLSEVVEAEVQ